MRSLKLCGPAGLLLAFACLLIPPALFAHAILVRSTPAAHASVSGDSLVIELHFNSRIDGPRSKLSLEAPHNSQPTLAPATQPAPDTLASSAHHLAPGPYTLHWIVLASDGHISRGQIPFTVR